MNKYKYTNQILFFIILFAVLAYRYLVLLKFGYKYTDSDQTIMWQGLEDYSNGIFYEPRFYGQAYNSMLESFLAIPLYKLGAPTYIALPLITSVLTLIPYLGFSIFLFFEKKQFIALITLSIPLLLPIEYSFITSLSRGFVTGIFLSSAGVLFVLFNVPKKYFLFGLFTGLGFSANPNSIILTFPIAIFLIYNNKNNLQFYLHSAIGGFLAFVFHFLMYLFYQNNPSHNIHKHSLHFSFSDIIKGVSNLDSYFNHVSPFFWKNSFVLLIAFLIFGGVAFLKKKPNKGLFLLAVPAIIIIALGIDKVHDGYESIFFSKSRMFLAFPVLIAFGLTLIKKINFQFKYLLLIIPSFFFVLKIYNLEKSILENSSFDKKHIVAIQKVESIKRNCKQLNNIAKEFKVELIIIVNSYGYDFYNYACRSCEINFPKTLRPIYERRTWRLKQDKNKVYQTILILDNKNKYPHLKKINEEAFLVQKNTLKTMVLMEKLNIECRQF